MAHDSENCKEVFALLSEYLDFELPPQARAEIEQHLAGVCAVRGVRGELAEDHRALPDLPTQNDARPFKRRSTQRIGASMEEHAAETLQPAWLTIS